MSYYFGFAAEEHTSRILYYIINDTPHDYPFSQIIFSALRYVRIVADVGSSKALLSDRQCHFYGSVQGFFRFDVWVGGEGNNDEGICLKVTGSWIQRVSSR
jgi:hypothetical protein